MEQTSFFFYTNLLAPYMFHRWRMIVDEFPGSLIVLTGKPDPERPWPYSPEEMDFPCVAVPESIHISIHLAWSKGLKNIVKSANGKKVVHLIEAVSGLNALRIIGTARGNAFAMMSDGGFPETTQRPTQRLRWNLVGKRCHGAISPGEAGSRYMRAWGFPPEKTYNSYLSHDVRAFAQYRDSDGAAVERSEIRNSLGLASTDVLALCVSRLLDWKRLEDLAESLPKLSLQTQKQLCILLIGDGNYTKPLSMFKSQNRVRFKWIPAVAYEEMVKYYAASDFLALPSEGDIWGLVVNEALSMGKPVVCTNRIGSSELVNNGWNGFKVALRNPEALAHAIENIVENGQLRQSMSKNALTIETTWHSGLFIEELKRLVRDLGWEGD